MKLVLVKAVFIILFFTLAIYSICSTLFWRDDSQSISMTKVMLETPHIHVYYVDCSSVEFQLPEVLLSETNREQPNKIESIFVCYDKTIHSDYCKKPIGENVELDPILHWFANTNNWIRVTTRLSESIRNVDQVEIPPIDTFFVDRKTPTGACFELQDVFFHHCDLLIDILDTPIWRLIKKDNDFNELTIVDIQL